MARIVLNVSSVAKPKPTGIARFVTALVPLLIEGAPQHDFLLGLRPGRWSDREFVGVSGLPGDRLRLLVPPYRSLWKRWQLLHSMALWLPRSRPRFPMILTVQDISTLDVPEFFGARWSERRGRKIQEVVPLADFIITPSEFTRERVVERLGIPPERVRTIPHGIDTDRFHPSPPEDVQKALAEIGVTPPYVLGSADHPRRKGLTTLLDAFAEIADAVPHSLVLFGGTKKGVDGVLEGRSLRRVQVLGYVSDTALRALYRGADAFAFPSRYEGFGLPILEAMACGAPVIVPDEGVFREVAGDGAALFEPGSVKGLAETLRGLLDNDSLQDDLRARGFVRATEFPWSEIARRTLDVYEEVLRAPLERRR